LNRIAAFSKWMEAWSVDLVARKASYLAREERVPRDEVDEVGERGRGGRGWVSLDGARFFFFSCFFQLTM